MLTGDNVYVIRTTDQISIPDHVISHVDIVSGVSDFSRRLHRPATQRARARAKMQKTRSELSSGDDTQPSVLFLENGNHDLVVRPKIPHPTPRSHTLAFHLIAPSHTTPPPDLTIASTALQQLRFQPSCLEQSDYGNLCNHTSFDHEIEGFVVKIQFVNSTDVIEKFFHRKQVSCENDEGWIQQCDAYLSDMPNNWQRYTVSMATNFTDGTATSPLCHILYLTCPSSICSGKQSSFSSPSPSVVNGAWALPHVIRRVSYHPSALPSLLMQQIMSRA